MSSSKFEKSFSEMRYIARHLMISCENWQSAADLIDSGRASRAA
jgi:hypothetical protein